MFVDFAMLAMDPIVNQAAKYHLMTGGLGRVPLVVRTQGGSGTTIAAQHSQSLEALFYHIPGLKVAMPSTPHDAKGLLKSAIRDDAPVIFIEHKLLYTTTGEVPSAEYLIPLGEADIKRPGRDVTLIAWSNMVPRSLAAAEKLAGEGIEVEVVDPRTLVPWISSGFSNLCARLNTWSLCKKRSAAAAWLRTSLPSSRRRPSITWMRPSKSWPEKIPRFLLT